MLTLYANHPLESGTDEAGRGCLAGPVTAAAVILPENFTHPWLDDSKKVSGSKRSSLENVIKAQACSFAVAHVMPKEIDELNILRASITAMHRAIGQLHIVPKYIAVDGNKFYPYKDIPYQCIVKGDAKYMTIAAASILAKTARDRYMEQLHEEYPMYQWKQNKGYPTKTHRKAIREHGSSPYHRKSFKLLEGQLKLNF